MAMADTGEYRSQDELAEQEKGLTRDSGYGSVEEEWMTCPYMNTHKVSAARFEYHLLKCRRNYRQSLVDAGEMVIMLTCKHNYRHQVDAMELQFHESRCPDADDFVPHYFKYLHELDGLDLTPELKEALKQLTEEDDATMYDGFNFDEVNAACNYNRPITIEEFIAGRKKKGAEVTTKGKVSNRSSDQITQSISGMTTTPPSKDTPGSSQACSSLTSPHSFLSKPPNANILGAASLSAQGASGASTSPGRVLSTEPSCSRGSDKRERILHGRPPTDLGGSDEDDDDDYWDSNPNIQTFDYMERWKNPKCPVLRYPEGLNKAQRRAYVEWNSKWMEAILEAEKATSSTQGCYTIDDFGCIEDDNNQ